LTGRPSSYMLVFQFRDSRKASEGTSMAIKFVCDCGRELNLKDEFAGKKGKCPGCGAVIHVPTPEETEAQAAALAAAAEAEAAPEIPPEVATKPCVHCKKLIPAEAIFCVHCGTHLRTGKKHEGGAEGEGEDEEFDFFKAAPDMILHPTDAVGAIVEAPPSGDNLKKALIFFAVGMVFFTWIIPYNNEAAIRFGIDPQGLSVWSFVLAGLVALVVVLTDVVVCNVAGTMFGTAAPGFAGVFMAVLTARAIVGLAMIIPGLYFLASKMSGAPPMPIVMEWLPRVIRLVWGTLLIHCVILRSYDCGPIPAIVFAAGSTLIRAIMFWLAGFIPRVGGLI